MMRSFNWKPIGQWRRYRGRLVRKVLREIQQQEDRKVPIKARVQHSEVNAEAKGSEG